MNKLLEGLFDDSGVDSNNGGNFQERRQFQEHNSHHKIIVFQGLNPHSIMFSRNSLSTKKLHLIYDWDHRHYDVMTNLKGAVAKNYLCNGCVASYDSTYKCGKVCSLYTATPPCIKDQSKNCSTYNRRILSEEYFQNHLTHNVKVKLVSQW